MNGDIELEDFDAVTPFFLTEGVNRAGLINIELLNISQANELNYIDDGLAWSGWTPFFHGNLYYTDPDAMINLILPSSMAFGGDFESADSHDGLILQVNGFQYQLGDEMDSDVGTGFLGFTSTDAFETITFFDQVQGAFRRGESFSLDNVRLVEVPEPITLSFLGLGFGALCVQIRKKSIGCGG